MCPAGNCRQNCYPINAHGKQSAYHPYANGDRQPEFCVVGSVDRPVVISLRQFAVNLSGKDNCRDCDQATAKNQESIDSIR
jgi:hypothetical protein